MHPPNHQPMHPTKPSTHPPNHPQISPPNHLQICPPTYIPTHPPTHISTHPPIHKHPHHRANQLQHNTQAQTHTVTFDFLSYPQKIQNFIEGDLLCLPCEVQWAQCAQEQSVDWVWPAGCLNIKMLSYQYKDSHVKDKTVSLTVLSLTWESPYLGKTVFILRQGPGGNLWPLDTCQTHRLGALGWEECLWHALPLPKVLVNVP